MPAARPRPSAHAISRPRSASRARHACERRLGRLGQPALERADQPRERRLDVARLEPQRRRRQAVLEARAAGRAGAARRAAPRGAPRRSARCPSTAQPLLRAALDEDARELGQLRAGARGGRLDDDVVRPLDARPALPRPRTRPRRRAAAAAAAGRAARATSAASCPPGADQRRPWRPRPAVCSAAVTSVPCGAPAMRQLARALVGRVGAAQVHARVAEGRGGALWLERARGPLTPGAPSARRPRRRRAARRPSRG